MIDFITQIHRIPDSDLNLLTSKLKLKKVNKGEHIAVPGQIQTELFIVESGIQMVHYETAEKSHIISFTYSPNFILIPEALSFQKPSEYYITCLTDSSFKCLPFEDLQLLFDQSQPIERLFRKMTERVLSGILNRYIETRTLTIEERFKIFCRRSPHLLNSIPHKYIASYLGIDPTNFSKMYNSIKL